MPLTTGTSARSSGPREDERQFEVASHQWIDLTDQSGAYGATILTDVKNGSDKPDDHTIRLTLIRTPGGHQLYRPVQPGLGPSRNRLRHRRPRRRLARRPDRLAGPAPERSADRVRNAEARRRAGQRVLAAEGRQSAHPRAGAEEGGDERRGDAAHGGDGRQARNQRAREVRRSHRFRARSERRRNCRSARPRCRAARW